jgi:hypothetical protein
MRTRFFQIDCDKRRGRENLQAAIKQATTNIQKAIRVAAIKFKLDLTREQGTQRHRFSTNFMIRRNDFPNSPKRFKTLPRDDGKSHSKSPQKRRSWDEI